ncbi:HAMP domain-containing histidine kinase [Blastococcus sp. CT_GayMR20]|uniref:sensor histidine kinase n=1 Tax=Blastococcus sp. CT_GayMR20 TaxID=2559609 RepID=UPI0010746E1E|nr:HAMP domain-containing sensor histidine kinase [Blastococcus sp. CT_GayMR20]TFV68381.1 HAMP domain-containing histidine kinase [Blastococcus sp. CT_GayMR20]
MSAALGARGLRARIVLGFAVGTLLVSVVLVSVTFLLARSYLLDQREAFVLRQAFADANVLNMHLSTAGTEVGDALGDLIPSGGADVVVSSEGSWFSSTLDVGARDVPAELQEVVDSGSVATVRVDTAEGPRLVVGVPLPSAGAAFYEVAPLSELEQVLHTLAAVLGAGALAATAAGAAFGGWASRRAVQPLEQVAGAATRIAGGDLATRLAETDDPDLVAIVASFNSMVDALAARIERDARFVGDVSHELRSPLTTLVTSVEVLSARRHELSPRAQQALGMVESELGRFRRTLDDLLQLARLDGAAELDRTRAVSLSALVREVLLRCRISEEHLLVDPDADTTVEGDKTSLERAVRNLLENAAQHGDGVREVRVEHRDAAVLVTVDDAGAGVAPEDRERIFERFARGPRAARRSSSGAGLGLAIVAETAARHGGAAWCCDAPSGGARFAFSLPRSEP